ncbi:MAG: site-2 protease family protein [Patescibacteria group bacterium]|nr:site-2 protease family protein [Patescibacteria group bacterium]MDE2437795.1 site-2 protease family protein [Patescibacteria group bacterium]
MNFSIAIAEIAILIFSVIIHEISHGYVAEMLGDETARRAGRLTLNPLSHLDPIGSVLLPLVLFISGAPIIGWAKPVPYNPYNLRDPQKGGGLIALAGPASNLVFAGLFSLLLHGLLWLKLVTPVSLLLINTVILINVSLALFNLVPIPPLDGSKVLFALLPPHMRNVQVFLERNGLLILFLFIFFGFGLIVPAINALVSLLAVWR